MPARRSEHSTVPLWCLAVALVFCDEGPDLKEFRAGSKWSQSASKGTLDVVGNDVAWEHSHRIRLRWRVHDVQGKATFSGPGHRLDAQRLIDDVERAHVEGWARGADNRPIPPAQHPIPLIETVLDGSGGADRTEAPWVS